ncbi:TPA: MarC family protein [Candidatus Micrarchaeota archaeon]|nr:MarC family protein [Candidatus Micrarchaeota archaeon]
MLQLDPRMFEFALTSFIAIMIIINPLSTIGLFLYLTKNDKEAGRGKIAFMCSLASFIVLVFFALTGFLIFQLYSITLEAFRIAGGVVLLLIGLRMLFPPASEHKEVHAGSSIWLVPLAIPMTSGPGAITTAVVLSTQVNNPWMEISLWAAIFVACAINFVVLRNAGWVDRRIGTTGAEALIKIMGLLVCAVGVQYMITGLKAAFPLLA